MSREAKPLLQPEWITLLGQENDPQPARFKIRALTGTEASDLVDVFHPETGEPKGRACRRACEIAIMDYENYVIDGAQPPWRPDLLPRLSPREISQLGSEIINRSYNTPDQAKN